MKNEKATTLPDPFGHIEITYPYNWPGFKDPVSVMNNRTGNGNILEADYLRAVAAVINESELNQ
ncbi:hypothetical protein [Curtobacterium sp. MCLR17_034]|uniref:hypothetical protein n=1 Tax=Curtobacterium sp. MCLR17_034 TaxID=2175623 RepID=UPI0011B7376E|nr:hypothetical protein [Curtobacterium sp. MCLR17_034]